MCVSYDKAMWFAFVLLFSSVPLSLNLSSKISDHFMVLFWLFLLRIWTNLWLLLWEMLKKFLPKLVTRGPVRMVKSWMTKRAEKRYITLFPCQSMLMDGITFTVGDYWLKVDMDVYVEKTWNCWEYINILWTSQRCILIKWCFTWLFSAG